MDLHDGVGAGRRQRAELPVPEPLLPDRPGPERPPVQPHRAAVPGNPLGEQHRRRPRGTRLLHDGRCDPVRHRCQGEELRGRRRGGGSVRGDGPPLPGRLALGLRVEQLEEGGRAGTDAPGPGPNAEALRLRRELERQPLAGQPAPPAGRLRPRDRRRADRALDANAPGVDDDRAAAQGNRRPAGQGVHPEGPDQGRAERPRLLGRAVARPAGEVLPHPPGARRLERAGERERRVPDPREVEPPLRPRRARGRSLPAVHREPLLHHDAATDRDRQRPMGGRGRVLHPPVRPLEPGQHAQRPGHHQPARGQGARRRRAGPALGQHPARRDAAPVPVRHPRGQADPDPWRPRRSLRRLQRDQLLVAAPEGLPGRHPRLELRRGDWASAAAAARCASTRSSPTASPRIRARLTTPTTPARSRASAGSRSRSAPPRCGVRPGAPRGSPRDSRPARPHHTS